MGRQLQKHYIICEGLYNALRLSWIFFLTFFLLDTLLNLDLATAMWQIGYEPFPSPHVIWLRWSYAELHAFHLVE